MFLEFVNTPTRSAIAWRGLANILLGIIIVVWPQLTIYVVIVFFAFNLMLVGLYYILEPLFDKANQHALATTALGILTVTFGVYLIIKPEFAAGIIGLLVAFWALLFGIVDLVVASRSIRAGLDFAWVFLLAGIISVVFGVFMLLYPVKGILSIVWVVGLYAIIVGVLLLLSSILMKSGNKTKSVSKKKGKKNVKAK